MCALGARLSSARTLSSAFPASFDKLRMRAQIKGGRQGVFRQAAAAGVLDKGRGCSWILAFAGNADQRSAFRVCHPGRSDEVAESREPFIREPACRDMGPG